MKGFIHFLRTQGIFGLAIGFIIGGASQQFVTALSKDILSPIVGRALGSVSKDIATASSTVYGITFGWGDFLAQFINLVLIALVVYFTIYHLAKYIDEKKD